MEAYGHDKYTFALAKIEIVQLISIKIPKIKKITRTYTIKTKREVAYVLAVGAFSRAMDVSQPS